MLDSVKHLAILARMSERPDGVAVSDDEAIARIQRSLESLMRLNASRGVYARQAAVAGVTISQPAYLLLRRLAEDGPLAMGELARRTHMDPGATARQVAQLEDDALVRRYPSREDGRVNLVKATPRGEAAGRRVARVRNGHMLETLEDWSPGERADFGRLLARFVDELRSRDFYPPPDDD